MGMLAWPMIALGWVVNLMERGSASLGRIDEVMQQRPSITEPESARPLSRIRGEVELRDVHVRFDAAEALQGVSLRIPADPPAAIVGHTGSGKTTLVNLIPRMIDPTSGSVRVDGHDVREYSPSRLREQIGFVPQETFLFSMTLGENIALGTRDATEEKSGTLPKSPDWRPTSSISRRTEDHGR